MRIVFFGTPDFAVATLQAIDQSQHEIVGVVTTPDKPAGRGLKLKSSDVKNYAIARGLPLLLPVNLKDLEFIEALKRWNADVFVVVAFKILPTNVYSIPTMGTFNVHASLLPQYRGAAPIHWAIMNGETKTGVTTFFLNNEIDCGDIILQKETEILPNETTGELYDRLKIIGAGAALETLDLIHFNKIQLTKQCTKNNILKLAPKIHKDETVIDWNKPAREIVNKIRGLSPYPGAVTFLTNKEGKEVILKIFKAVVLQEKSKGNEGKMSTDNKSFLHISSRDFLISLQNMQLEGKKRLNIDIFLQSINFENYTNL